MINLSDIAIAMVFVPFCLLWWNAQGVKQAALAATRRYCKKMEVQLLDDVVSLRGFWFKRNKRGALQLWRSYNFEFTATGDERYGGQIVLIGRQIESIELAPHRLN